MENVWRLWWTWLKMDWTTLVLQDCTWTFGSLPFVLSFLKPYLTRTRICGCKYLEMLKNIWFEIKEKIALIKFLMKQDKLYNKVNHWKYFELEMKYIWQYLYSQCEIILIIFSSHIIQQHFLAPVICIFMYQQLFLQKSLKALFSSWKKIFIGKVVK